MLSLRGKKRNTAWALRQEHSFTFFNLGIVFWTVLSVLEDKRLRPFELALRSRGLCVSKSVNVWHLWPRGVIHLLWCYWSDRETPLICDQWESLIKSELDWTNQTNRLFWFPQHVSVRFHLWSLCSVMLLLTSGVNSMCVGAFVQTCARVAFSLCQWTQLLKRLSFRNILLAWKTVTEYFLSCNIFSSGC